MLPLLTGMADYGGKKKMFLKIFAYLGSAACMGLFFFEGANIEYGILMAVIASIGYSGSLVFYNAFLPEISTSDRYDKISARGYSYGYICSVLLLIFNLVMIQMPELFGLESGSMPAKISFLTVGVWWVAFAQYTFKYLPEKNTGQKLSSDLLIKGYKEIRKVYASLKELPTLKKYLLSFFFYNAGVQSVMYLATLFGTKELNMDTGSLILTVLIIQLVGIGGAYLFAYVSKLKGNKKSIMIMIIIWIGICLGAYFVATQNQFYALAFVVGLVMGGIQALSRATYSKLIPQDTEDTASYFSFFDVTFNVSIVFGTLSYGVIEHLTGSMRNSALALGLFFIVGMVILGMTKMTFVRDHSSNKSN